MNIILLKREKKINDLKEKLNDYSIKLNEMKLYLKKENEVNSKFIINEFKNDINDTKSKLIKEIHNDIKKEKIFVINKINNITNNLNEMKNELSFDLNSEKEKTNKEIIDIKLNMSNFQNYVGELEKNDRFFKKAINYHNLIYNFISIGIKRNFLKKINNFTLIFKASIDGYESDYFHRKCDGKMNTLTIIRTITGKIFGGFTNAKWDETSQFKPGSSGFIFSLDNREIYYNKNSKQNIWCSKTRGPTFGYNDFVILSNGKEGRDNSGRSYETFNKTYALAGEREFLIEDYEVYQLNFIE